MEKQKVAAITGITGQLGFFLTKILLEKGYKVYGMKRRSSSHNTDRINSLYQDPHEENINLELIYGDVTDYNSVANFVKKTKADLFFNLSSFESISKLSKPNSCAQLVPAAPISERTFNLSAAS